MEDSTVVAYGCFWSGGGKCGFGRLPSPTRPLHNLLTLDYLDLPSILTSVSIQDEFLIKLELSFLSCLQRLSQVVQNSLK